ncbi:TetR/AcrR family transcriptional regulator [Paenibacillus sp. GXUN7292]|uniref:TetR/AcrR family transcriptional regulator n=1 Tax=Paenibacillus sp. GXUN7292 TaxID=3422499 RepID=UPI003D7CF47D
MSPRAGLDLSIIIEAAVELADTQGLQEVTLASVAKKLGVRSPSLYNHINGLPELQAKLAAFGIEKLYAALHKAIANYRGDDAIRAVVKSYISFARANPGLYSATLKAPDSSDIEWMKASEKVVELLVEVVKYYGLDEQHALHTVRICRSMLHGFASLEQSGGFGLPLDLDVTLKLLTNTLLSGIHHIQKQED